MGGYGGQHTFVQAHTTRGEHTASLKNLKMMSTACVVRYDGGWDEGGTTNDV